MIEIKMHLPKVSILIPVYNREALIGECIQSALDQTFSDFEVIIVDNASTDNTLNICNQYAAKDNRIRVFCNNINVGPVRNWLRCVSEAQGEFGKILFSDDLMLPQFLEDTLPYMEDETVAFVATAAIIGESPTNGAVQFAYSGEQPIMVEHYFKMLIESNVVPNSPGAALFRMKDIRTNLLISIPTQIYRDFSINGAGPDVLLYSLTALSYQRVIILAEPKVFFRIHTDSITVLNNESQVTEGYRAAIAWFCKNKLSKVYWARYIAYLWWVDVKKMRSLVSLRGYSQMYEGTDTIDEIKALLFAVIVVVASDLRKKLSVLF